MSSDEEAQAAIAALNETEQDAGHLKFPSESSESRGPRVAAVDDAWRCAAVVAVDAAADMAAAVWRTSGGRSGGSGGGYGAAVRRRRSY